MKASIIIPTCNRVDQLSRAIKSLVALDFDPSQYEIIVADNGSKDNTKEVVEKYIAENPKHIIRYIYDEIPGLLTGRHRGAKEAESEILIFIDDDIRADKDWLNATVDSFESYPDIHLIGGKCLPKFEIAPPSWLDYFWIPVDGGKMLCELSLCDFGDTEKIVDPTWVWGLNYSIRKKSLYELGGFHPDNIPKELQHYQGDGETGLSAEAFRKGYKALYQPKALVHHEVPASRLTLEYFDKRYFYQGVANSYTDIRKKYYRKNIPTIKKIKDMIYPWYEMIFLKKTKKQKYDTPTNPEKEKLLERFMSKEKEGYNFHQEAVRKSHTLLQWVLKENYFDYTLPKL